MKTMLLSFAALSFSFAALACKTPVDAKKAVVFIDTNYSTSEVEAARSAACLRGETFVLLPYGIDVIKKVQAIESHILPIRNEIRERMRKLRKGEGTESDSTYQTLRAQAKELELQVEQLKGRPLQEVVAEKLEKLASGNVAIKAVVISGHDGGGYVSGDSGKISKTEFSRIMHAAYKGKESLEAELETVLMWGCYTATPSEVMAWRAEFPKLKILAGFYEMGPLSTRPASYDLLRDLLVKSQSIAKNCNEAELKAAIRNLTHISMTLAAISVVTNCQNEYYYLRKTIGQNDGASSRAQEVFSRFAVSCNSTEVDVIKKGMLNQVNGYLIGLTPIPENTSRSFLRTLYSSSRSLQHCVEKNTALDPDKVGLLLFWKGLHENFFKVFGQETLQAEKDFNLLLEGTSSKTMERLVKDGIALPLDLKRATPDRLVLENLTNVMSKLIITAKVDNPGAREAAGRLLAYQKRLNRILCQVDVSCVDFLDWHEAKDGHTPKVLCDFGEEQ